MFRPVNLFDACVNGNAAKVADLLEPIFCSRQRIYNGDRVSRAVLRKTPSAVKLPRCEEESLADDWTEDTVEETPLHACSSPLLCAAIADPEDIAEFLSDVMRRLFPYRTWRGESLRLTVLHAAVFAGSVEIAAMLVRVDGGRGYLDINQLSAAGHTAATMAIMLPQPSPSTIPMLELFARTGRLMVDGGGYGFGGVLLRGNNNSINDTFQKDGGPHFDRGDALVAPLFTACRLGALPIVRCLLERCGYHAGSVLSDGGTVLMHTNSIEVLSYLSSCSPTSPFPLPPLTPSVVAPSPRAPFSRLSPPPPPPPLIGGYAHLINGRATAAMRTTALHMAAASSRYSVEAMRILVEGGFGVDVHAVDAEGMTALRVAAGANCSQSQEDRDNSDLQHVLLEKVRYLAIVCGVDINLGDTCGDGAHLSPMMAAAAKGNVLVVRYLLSLGEDPLCDEGAGAGTVCATASGSDLPIGSEDVGRQCPSRTHGGSGHNVESVDGAPCEGLGAACDGRLRTAAAMLASLSTPPSLPGAGHSSSRGVPALLWPRPLEGYHFNGRDTRGIRVDTNCANGHGITALHAAVSGGSTSGVATDADSQASSAAGQIVAMLIAAGAMVDTQCTRSCFMLANAMETPLHTAVRDGKMDVAQLLIDNGADIFAIDDEGRTPMSFLASSFSRLRPRFVADGPPLSAHDHGAVLVGRRGREGRGHRPAEEGDVVAPPVRGGRARGTGIRREARARAGGGNEGVPAPPQGRGRGVREGTDRGRGGRTDAFATVDFMEGVPLRHRRAQAELMSLLA